MKLIENRNFPNERDLYASDGVHLKNCTFSGEADGESALKESSRVIAEGCTFELRYPFWHDTDVSIIDCELTATCRAALWYSDGVRISSSRLHGIKALRECRSADIADTDIVSPEFGWKCNNVSLKNVSAESEYFFLLSKDLVLENVRLTGKYSFQYTENVTLDNCRFNTKDSFWHAKNVTVRDSEINGEYLGWYSEGLTFENCVISGTQPFCYCKGLKLVNCRMKDADFSFEYSEVDADIRGDILSVKNPLSGRIVADSIGEVILTDDSRYECRCEIIKKDVV